jgi:4-carboxymuconolactone decarboxylase
MVSLAIKAGLSPDIVAELKTNKRPSNMPPEESVVYDFVTELTTTHVVSDETFNRAKQLLGEQQVVDLTAVAGTYVTAAMILAMSEESVPPGKELPSPVNRSYHSIEKFVLRSGWMSCPGPKRTCAPHQSMSAIGT